MHICIVDDEKSCQDILHELLTEYASHRGETYTFDIFSDGESFLSAYAPEKYDIIFLDIYIGETTGMDLAKAVRQSSEHGMIIFCTTSLEDMPQAFRYHAFEYIIKPAQYSRIEKVMNDAIAVLPQLERYMEFTSNREPVRLAFSDFIYVTTNGHYLSINATGSRSYSTRMTLADLSRLIGEDERFLTLNKGVLVNMDHIRTIEDRNCVMDDGQMLPVKVRESNNIKKRWQDYCFAQIRKNQRGNV